MSIPNIIAGQLHNTKPDHLRPGADVGMVGLGDLALGIYIRPLRRVVVVAYDEGGDWYNVAVRTLPGTPIPAPTMDRVMGEFSQLHSATLGMKIKGDVQKYERVYCDQIGEFVWGDDSKNFTMPMVQIKGDDGEWEVIA